ncbi:hypothetical protein COLO4_21801 [Corchorus olitorius]|uniref:Uncharacterized protein n=1 Tax=Corchorus olitorius TaxID=93759 RepID=A0A1R3IQQ8_9ROSI|nr:hypothetical protein COLO4_21801 [Corchorus olitorius]
MAKMAATGLRQRMERLAICEEDENRGFEDFEK